MNSIPLPLAAVDECWNRIGIRGDRSCPELAKHVHCHNCPTFAEAGRRFLEAASPDGYLQEWTNRLAHPLRENESNLIGVLVFRLGEEWLALPVDVVVEVAPIRAIRRIPHRGGLLAGLVNFRGELHLCVRMDQLLGLTHSNSNELRSRLVVVKHDNDSWVFAVDEVDQVQRLPSIDLHKSPATLARASSRLSRGVFHHHDRAIGLLDPSRLFEILRERVR
jgi:chemotaxis-related protein WspD